jgi:hypothetical protein
VRVGLLEFDCSSRTPQPNPDIIEISDSETSGSPAPVTRRLTDVIDKKPVFVDFCDSDSEYDIKPKIKTECEVKTKIETEPPVPSSDVLVWFGFQTMVLVWFRLVLVPESSNQNQNHGIWFGLVWFWFKPWFCMGHS